MSETRASYFSLLLGKTESPTAICTSLLLAFMAQADGHLSAEERSLLASSAETLMPGMDEGRKNAILEELLAIASGKRIDDLVLACRTLQQAASEVDTSLIIDLLIGMMVSDSRVSLAEHYVMEFIADLLALTPDDLNEVYKHNTGRERPQKGDPSSRVWWEIRTHRHQQQSTGTESDSVRTSATPTSVGEAYRVLGVSATASKEEIQKAYRRLAMRHHPDRFQSLGDEAVKRATLTFTHIKQAYDLLRAS